MNKKINTFCDWLLNQIPPSTIYGQLEIGIGSIILPFIGILSIFSFFFNFNILPIALVIIAWYKLATIVAAYIFHVLKRVDTRFTIMESLLIAIHLIDVAIVGLFRKAIAL
jgi:hypothetical protein